MNYRGIYSFYNVCIETIVNKRTGAIEGSNLKETKQIVVYNSINESKEGIMKRIEVAGSEHLSEHHWNISFTSASIPEGHKLLPTTAFFVAPTLASNFHHFWDDEFLRLFYVVSATNRLHAGMDNQIVYRNPQPLATRLAFEDILITLYIAKHHDVFYNLLPNTFYRSAVFGTVTNPGRDRDAVNNVLASFNIPMRLTTDVQSNLVIVQRTFRCILNTENLATTARTLGFLNVKVVILEKMSLKDQMATVANSGVVVGRRPGSWPAVGHVHATRVNCH